MTKDQFLKLIHETTERALAPFVGLVMDEETKDQIVEAVEDSHRDLWQDLVAEGELHYAKIIRQMIGDGNVRRIVEEKLNGKPTVTH